MGKHLHLFRRGSVFYWRRRVPGLSTSIDILQLSLRTGVQAEACMIARKLTVESDRMFDDLTHNLISVEDARTWLSHVITQELARIRRVDLVARLDPVGRAEADIRADWATATAWRLMAEHGPRADLDPSVIDRLIGDGATPADLVMLETTLAMLAGDMRSEARKRRTSSAFRTVTGSAQPLDSTALLQLRRLLIGGRAAAHAQREAVLGAETQIMADMAEQIAAGIMARDRLGWLGDDTPPDADPEPSPPQWVPVAMPQPASALTVPQRQPAPAEAFDSSVLATTERLNAERLEIRKQERKHLVREDGTPEMTPETMERSRLVTARLFTQATGVSDIRQIRPSHLSVFRDTLHRLPSSWGKSKKDVTRPIEDAFTQAAKLPPGKVGFAVATINRHLDVMALILARAEEDGIPVDPKLQPKKLRLREHKRARDKRAGFKEADLNLLFRHTIWTGCESQRRRNVPGKRIIKDGLYWAPLIAAYTGARREEIAGMMCADIREEDGIVYFDIRDNANRGVKTLAGERRIPIHDRLIQLGFLTYLAKLRGRKERDLFPDFRPENHVKNAGSKFGAALYHRFSTALDVVFAGNPKGFVNHSFRHFVNDRLSRVTTIPKLVRIELVGHEGDDTNERVYTEPSPLRDLQVAINALPVVDDLVPG